MGHRGACGAITTIIKCFSEAVLHRLTVQQYLMERIEVGSHQVVVSRPNKNDRHPDDLFYLIEFELKPKTFSGTEKQSKVWQSEVK